MRAIILLAICAACFTACRCELPEDEDKKKTKMKPVPDTIKIK